MGVAAQPALGQESGSIRGRVTDADFDDAPVPEVTVRIVETDQQTTTGEQGNYTFTGVEPGTYTLVFSKADYTRSVESNVVVTAGQLTDVDVSLSGDFVELGVFVVQELQLAAGSEAALINLRLESPSLLDSVGEELLSQAGAGDAAAGLRLVSGATVRDDKAVVRGLPDRFVSSQLNGLRLPSADAETRAVELDQFASDVIESIQVSKTFTPDQQGDASGGAVNIVTKSVPEEPVFKIGIGTEINTQTAGRSDFLSYRGGGLNFAGTNAERESYLKNFTETEGLGIGGQESDTPHEYSVDLTAGGSVPLGEDFRLGGIVSVFYERDATFFDNGIDDELTARGINPDRFDNELAPTTSVRPGIDNLTKLYDVKEATQELQWGGLFSAGIEGPGHSIKGTLFHVRTVTDTVTVLEDTRGKAFFFPEHDPDNPPFNPAADNGAFPSPEVDANEDAGFGDNSTTSPYNRLETLRYTERVIRAWQFTGNHELPMPEFGVEDWFMFQPIEVDWSYALSMAEEDEPDRRQFGEWWEPAQPATAIGPTLAPFVPGDEGDIINAEQPAVHHALPPDNTFAFGNFQRVFERVKENSNQYKFDVTFPFEQWSGDRGYFKLGLFSDKVDRTFNQETFTNDLGLVGVGFLDTEAPFDEPLSDFVEDGTTSLGPIIESTQDIDYDGEYDISAYYWMVDMPVTSWMNVIGGVRFESTDISIITDPEEDAVIVQPTTGALSGAFDGSGNRVIDPVSGLPLGDALFERTDVLPSLSLIFTPTETFTIRAAVSETLARPTFRELSPVAQQESLGGAIFIGNPNLRAAEVNNYDLRFDYRPREGSFFSFSVFRKDIKDPIEFVQRGATNLGGFDTAINFDKGRIDGVEFEARQDLGVLSDKMRGLSIGANATFLNSEVQLPESEIALLATVNAPIEKRNASNAPERLVNLNLTYNNEDLGTRLGLFYTLTGDTLIVGPGNVDGGFSPAVYAAEFGNLNFTASQKLGKYFNLKFSAKNLTNPKIKTIYRSDFTQDTVRTSQTEGIDLSVSLNASIPF